MLKLDQYDKKILYQLDVNARQPYTTIAKAVGISKDAVKYRINQYLKEGIIDSFYALTDSSKLGYMIFRVYFSFRNTTPEKEEAIMQNLSAHNNILWLSRVEGHCDVVIGFWAKSLKEFHTFWKDFRNYNSAHITHEAYSIFLERHDFRRNYLIGTNEIQTKYTVKEPSIVSIDDTDKLILEELTKDARISIINLAKKVNLTSKAVIYRIRNLENRKIIFGYKTKINIEKIGYSMYKVDMMLTNQEKIKELMAMIYNFPNIINAQLTFGGSDFEFDLEIRDFEEFNSVMNELKSKYGEYIESIKYYRTIKTYKTRTLPEKL